MIRIRRSYFLKKTAEMKRIHRLTSITSLTSVLLGAYYRWGFVLVWRAVEEEITFWGVVSMMMGTTGLMLHMTPFLMPKASGAPGGFWQAVFRVILALWHLGVLLLQIIPIVFWLSGGMISDKPYARKAVSWGAVPHVALLLLAVATLYQILKKWPSAARDV